MRRTCDGSTLIPILLSEAILASVEEMCDKNYLRMCFDNSSLQLFLQRLRSRLLDLIGAM
jgi:hypothetical protein